MEANGGFSGAARLDAVPATPALNPEARHAVLLRASQITKVFDATVALDGVDFVARAGCVNVLMGENGAGKSTLMKILAGEETADGGTIDVDGEVRNIRNPRDAAMVGIHIIHQELSLFPSLSVAENIYAAHPMTIAAQLAALGRQESAARSVLERLGLHIDPQALVGDLPLGHQQMVEIACAVAHENARVLIMDEPTSSLSSAETASLFGLIKNLTAEGVAVIYISHRMSEIAEIGDYITVLRDGRLVETARVRDVDPEWIVARMMGESGRRSLLKAKSDAREGALERIVDETLRPVLEVRNLTVVSPQTGAVLIDDVSFALRPGERLGIYGAVGAGRSELLECLIGLRAPEEGEILFRGAPVVGPTSARVRGGLFLVPEDRQAQGLFPSLSIADNIVMSNLPGVARLGVILVRALKQAVSRVRAELAIKASDVDLEVTTLSGGNQQKAILARALFTDPHVLILDEPTRGIDVGSKAEIVDLLRELSDRGPAVLFASSEIQEVLALSHRILVLARGKVTGEFVAAEATESLLLLASSPTNHSGVDARV